MQHKGRRTRKAMLLVCSASVVPTYVAWYGRVVEGVCQISRLVWWWKRKVGKKGQWEAKG